MAGHRHRLIAWWRRAITPKGAIKAGVDDLAAQMAGKVWLSGRADALVEVQHTLHQVLNYKGT